MFKKLKLVFVTSAVLIGGVAGVAAAKGHHGDRKAMQDKFDLNKDGTLDDGEHAKMKEAFGAMHARRKAEMLQKHDANKNGVLDPAEKQAMHAARAEARFTRLDANGDGTVSLDEFKAGRHEGGRMRHRL
ncbi:MAG: hypothetical protein WKG01_16165 [Kofleriaceae bacterium]